MLKYYMDSNQGVKFKNAINETGIYPLLITALGDEAEEYNKGVGKPIMQNHYVVMMKFIAQDHQSACRLTWRSDDSKNLAGMITRGETNTAGFIPAFDKCMNKEGKSELKDNLKIIEPEIRALYTKPKTS